MAISTAAAVKTSTGGESRPAVLAAEAAARTTDRCPQRRRAKRPRGKAQWRDPQQPRGDANGKAGARCEAAHENTRRSCGRARGGPLRCAPAESGARSTSRPARRHPRGQSPTASCRRRRCRRRMRRSPQVRAARPPAISAGGHTGGVLGNERRGDQRDGDGKHDASGLSGS